MVTKPKVTHIKKEDKVKKQSSSTTKPTQNKDAKAKQAAYDKRPKKNKNKNN